MPSTVNKEEVGTRPILDELVYWIKTLTAAGVSPDKAAEVARDFFLVPCGEELDVDGLDEYDEDYDEEDEE